MRIGGDDPAIMLDKDQGSEGFDLTPDKGHRAACRRPDIGSRPGRDIDTVIMDASGRRAEFGNNLALHRPAKRACAGRRDKAFSDCRCGRWHRWWHCCRCCRNRGCFGRHIKNRKIKPVGQNQTLAHLEGERRLDAIRLGKLILTDGIALGQRIDRILGPDNMRSRWRQPQDLADRHGIGRANLIVADD